MNLLKYSILFLLAFNMLISSSVASDVIINGDFETGNITGWTKAAPSGGGSVTYGLEDTGNATFEDYTLYVSGSSTYASEACIYQGFDASEVSNITFWTKSYGTTAGVSLGTNYQTSASFNIYNEFVPSTIYDWHEVTVDLTGYTSTVYIIIWGDDDRRGYLDNVHTDLYEEEEPEPTPTPTPEPTEEPFIFTPSNITEYLSYFSIIITWVGVSFILILHALLDSVLLILIGIFIGIMLATYAYRLYKSR